MVPVLLGKQKEESLRFIIVLQLSIDSKHVVKEQSGQYRTISAKLTWDNNEEA